MPRAKRRCATVGCRNFQPCKEHGTNWRMAKDKSQPLPTDWSSRRRFVRKRSRGRCEFRFPLTGIRCMRPAKICDHIIPRAEWPKGRPGLHDYHNLQDLCQLHSDQKTKEERQRGIDRRRQNKER